MKIHIIGGGIGGMSCALHLANLARQGYLDDHVEIRLYEQSERLGGKAQSQLQGFPGEHGFRFFPNFYRSIVDTLKDIELTAAHVQRRGLSPALAGKKVLDVLVEAPDAGVAMSPLAIVHRPKGLLKLPLATKQFFDIFGMSLGESLKFAGLLARFLTSCEGRMLAEYEGETLESFFMERHRMSPNFRRFMASLRALSAMRANAASLRTLLFTATQMLVDFDDEYRLVDAVLPGPTDWLMLEPWQQELERLGVAIELGVGVEALTFRPRGGHGVAPGLSTVTLKRKDGTRFELGPLGPDEHVVLAIPFERARPLFLEAEQRGSLPDSLLGVRAIEQRPDNLGTGAEPMVGIQFFMRRRTNLPRGHVLYSTSRWAMTSIAQAQFWEPSFVRPLGETFGEPALADIVSAIISAWDVPGRNGKAPNDSSEREILDEALAQMNEGLGAQHAISQSDILHAQVDRDIRFGAGSAHCPTPLWVSPAGSYLQRPTAVPGCSNFFIAADWARTETDVGSMESADEAARHAARAIAERAPLPAPQRALPEVRPLRLWKSVERARVADELLFACGLPHVLGVGDALRRRLDGRSSAALGSAELNRGAAISGTRATSGALASGTLENDDIAADASAER